MILLKLFLNVICIPAHIFLTCWWPFPGAIIWSTIGSTFYLNLILIVARPLRFTYQSKPRSSILVETIIIAISLSFVLVLREREHLLVIWQQVTKSNTLTTRYHFYFSCIALGNKYQMQIKATAFFTMPLSPPLQTLKMAIFGFYPVTVNCHRPQDQLSHFILISWTLCCS